jgi:hypothetical protein
MTTSQASRVFGIPYNSLLMIVRGKYGKSLRLDVLKKSTPAANDNLNTIGNSRSTPKEKSSIKKEEFKSEYSQHLAEVRKERNRKPSHEGNGMPIFPFDQSSLNPFSNGLLQFPPGIGEPFGLLGLAGLPPADSRIKDLMQSLQSQQAALSQTERIKSTVEEAFSETKENNENNKQNGPTTERALIPFQLHEEAREKALAALLMRARDDIRENRSEEFEPKMEDEEEEEEEDSKDDSIDTADIPQMAIKPVEMLPPPAVSKPLELNIPSAASEISAQ